MTPLPRGPRGIIWTNLQSVRDPIGTAERWRREYGDPMSGPSLDGQPALVTGSPEGLRAIFTAPPETFDTFGSEQLAALLGDDSLIVLSGARHSAMRRLLMPPFHGQRMRHYGAQMRDITLQQAQGLRPGVSFVAQELMHEISLQVIVRAVFGVDRPDRVARVVRLVSDFRRAFNPARLLLPMLLPWLRRELWGIGPWASLQRATRALRGFLEQEVAGRRSDPVERNDILALLCAARDEDGGELAARQISEQLVTLLHAGHGTTAIALTWALYFLAQDPPVLQRLRAELAALGPDPDPEALARAPFLEAVCAETLRVRPILGATARRLRAPLHVAGYDLAAGMSVVASVLWAHGDPETYPDPQRFRPERFLGRSYSPFEYLPFGGGHRRCIGAAFALYEMKLVLATLLSRCDFELATKAPVRVAQRDALVPAAPIRLIVRPLP